MQMVRVFYIIGGVISLTFAAIGALLPLVPTVPFVLLAAFCFSRGSPRIHRWLLNSKWFGPAIHRWEQHGAVSLRAKVIATVTLSSAMIFPVFIQKVPWGYSILMGVCLFIVGVYIWTRPTAPRRSDRNDN